MHPGFFYVVMSRLSFPLGVVSGFAGHCESVCALARNAGVWRKIRAMTETVIALLLGFRSL